MKRFVATRPRMAAAVGIGAVAVLALTGGVMALDKPSNHLATPMVLVPAGSFVMGSNTGAADEKPAHTVYVSAFRIDKYEVSVGDYEQCVKAKACRPPSTAGSETRNDYFRNNTYRSYPVVGITWDDARAFCSWRGMRLPTEAEWEKAARGTDGRTYPWGSTFDPTRLNYCDRNCDQAWRDVQHDDGFDDTAPVDSFPSGLGPYGTYNMAGNVWEWVADWYGTGYYAQSPARNPTGPATGTQRVIRGGGAFDDKATVASTMRRRFAPDVPSTSVGVRCAASGSGNLG